MLAPMFYQIALFLLPATTWASSLVSVVAAVSAPPTLNLTSLGARNGASTIECWQLANPFQTTQQVGVPGTLQLQLGDVSNMSYTIVPPKFYPAPHNAPIIQYGLFLSGEAHITLPSGAYEATIIGGKHGLVIATDTAERSQEGHTTIYPSNKETILIQIPIKDNIIPPHNVLHMGPCTSAESV